MAKLLPFSQGKALFCNRGHKTITCTHSPRTCRASQLQHQRICMEQISAHPPSQTHFLICEMINLEVLPLVLSLLMQQFVTSPFLWDSVLCHLQAEYGLVSVGGKLHSCNLVLQFLSLSLSIHVDNNA